MDLTIEKVHGLKCRQLQDELKKLKQPIWGTKAVLIQRLLNYKKTNSNNLTSSTNEQNETSLRITSKNVDDFISSTPTSSQSFSYSLRLEQPNISDIDEDSVHERKTKKEKNVIGY